MANEAVLLVEKSLPVNYTIDNATGIEKGTILKLSDPNTAAAADTIGNAVAGIAYGEKIASNGQTMLGVYESGTFKVLASGAIVAGQAVQSAGPLNYVMAAAVTSSGAQIMGYAKETAADDETFRMELKTGVGGAAIS